MHIEIGVQRRVAGNRTALEKWFVIHAFLRFLHWLLDNINYLRVVIQAISMLALENKQFASVNATMATKRLSLAADLLHRTKDSGLWKEFTIDHMAVFRKELNNILVIDNQH